MKKMAFFDKLKFWKKRTTPSEAGFDLGLPPPESPFAQPQPAFPGMEPQEFGQQQAQAFAAQYPPYVPVSEQPAFPSSAKVSFPQQQAPLPYPSPVEKDIEVISAKLDSIRATLESINQRLQNIERIAYSEQKRREW